MRRIDNRNVEMAREAIAGGRSLSPAGLFALANDLREQNDIGYARRIYAIAATALPPGPEGASQRDAVQIRLAQCTYGDPDLPVDERLKQAEAVLLDLLSRAASLTPSQHQEILGALGAVYKQRWSVYGHNEHLEKALLFYRSGRQLGIQPDLGYCAINEALALDILAGARRHAGDPGTEAAAALRKQGAAIRTQIVEALSAASADASEYPEAGWWLDCTLGEALLGLRRFDESRICFERAAARCPAKWRLEPAARQVAFIVRMQAAEDGIPLERLHDAPGFAALHDLLGGSANAAATFFLGKAGLALSGGGFRASLYHIGVLARLAELDMLRHVEVISCVSGGSIVGAYYYLEVRRLLQSKPDEEITRDDYVEAVRNVESGFVAGVQRNLRMRMMLEPGSNWKALTSRDSTTTDRLADLYERELYARIRDEKFGAKERYIQDLLIQPAGIPTGERFSPRYDNWRRVNKVPILVLNSTTLNTCHNWQFTATFMGEPPMRGIDSKIDSNDRLRRMYYEDAPAGMRRIRLGRAVAASACVPGLFDPLAFDRLYQEDYAAKLVDGGVFDNQGASSLREQDCTVLLVSDASGQTAVEKRPDTARISVSLRSNEVLMARGRQEQYELLYALRDAGVLRGFAFVHLKKELDARPVDWVDCPDPSLPDPKNPLTSYGIRKDVQARLAQVRTDLDAFSDVEADALMLSGYRMMAQEFESCIVGFPTAAQPVKWRFQDIEPLVTGVGGGPDTETLLQALDLARFQAFKALRLSPALKAGAALLGLLVAAGLWRVAALRFPLWLPVALAAWFAALQWILRRVFRNPNPLWQTLLAVPLLVLGGPLMAFTAGVVDPIYLRFGPKYRE